MKKECQDIVGELSAYVDGEGTAALRAQIETHVAGCADCRRHLAELRKIAEGVAALPKMESASEFLTDVRRKIAHGEEPQEETWVDWLFRPAWFKVPLEAVALIAIVVAVSALYRPFARKSRLQASGDFRAQEVARPMPARAIAPAMTPPASEPAPVVADLDATGTEGDRLAKREVATETATAAAPVESFNVSATADQVAAAPPPAGPVSEIRSTDVIDANKPASTGLGRDDSGGLAGSAEGERQEFGDRVYDFEKVAAEVPAETILVEGKDVGQIQRRAEIVAAGLNGRVIAPTQTGVMVHKFLVELPTGNVAAFKQQFGGEQLAESLAKLKDEENRESSYFALGTAGDKEQTTAHARAIAPSPSAPAEQAKSTAAVTSAAPAVVARTAEAAKVGESKVSTSGGMLMQMPEPKTVLEIQVVPPTK